jgi:hypothetical protein
MAQNQQENNTFSFGKGNENHELDIIFFSYIKRIISAFKRVELISDRLSYIILRGSWCDIIILNVQAATEDKLEAIHVQQISLEESNSNALDLYNFFLTFTKVIYLLKSKLIFRRTVSNIFS